MAAPGSGIKFLGLDSALVDLAEKKSTLSNNKQEYFTASDIANGITAFDNGIVINETGADSDTRIEGQTDANLFFADASTDRVGIGTNTPSDKLHTYNAGSNFIRVQTDSTNASGVRFYNASQQWQINGSSSSELILRDVTAGQNRIIIDSSGNVMLGALSALGTTATDGFTYIPTCAGTPTGTPTAKTGKVPMVYDTTNSIMYVYTGGAWTAV